MEAPLVNAYTQVLQKKEADGALIVSIINYFFQVHLQTMSSYWNMYLLLSNIADGGLYLICPPAFMDFFKQMQSKNMSKQSSLNLINKFSSCR